MKLRLMPGAVLGADQPADLDNAGALIGQLLDPRHLAAAIQYHPARFSGVGQRYRAVFRT